MSSAGQAEGRRTTPYNMIGFPALSVPSGFDSDGLPFGLQIATLPFTDWKTLSIGATFDDLGLTGNRRPSLDRSGHELDDVGLGAVRRSRAGNQVGDQIGDLLRLDDPADRAAGLGSRGDRRLLRSRSP